MSELSPIPGARRRPYHPNDDAKRPILLAAATLATSILIIPLVPISLAVELWSHLSRSQRVIVAGFTAVMVVITRLRRR